nr:hypothetical protein [Tanacetum cinerariifolium]
KKYSELSTTKAIQADCDVKATNIILQGLPLKVYALVSTHKVSKELWERIQMLMQGTSLTKQEKECKLYDEFDKFAYKKGESLHDFYLRFSLLLNDMNIYNMKLEQFQVNTKFLNTLPLEWSKFVTDVKLSSVNHNVYNPSSSIPQVKYALSVHQQSEFSQPDTGLVVPVFQKGDDLIDAINHMMLLLTAVVTLQYPPTNNQLRTSSNPHQQATINNERVTIQPIQGRQNSMTAVFQKGDDPVEALNHMMLFLIAVVTSRYPPTNNQLRNSSNPRQQATINNGRVTKQPIHGRQNSLAAGTLRPCTSGLSRNNSGKQRTVVCCNCKGEGHMSKQCIKPKRKRNEAWFKDKVLLVQAQENE